MRKPLINKKLFVTLRPFHKHTTPMKAYKTVIFIFCVLLGLALVSIVFPKDGVELCGVKFEFPSLTEALTTEAMATAQTEEEAAAIEDQVATLHNAKEQEFREFCSTSPNRIFCPNDDVSYLDGLFDQLENAKRQHVRIIHLGDSQLEGDRMTSSLRENFQRSFGGCGVGMVPAQQPVDTYTLTQSISPAGIQRVSAYGPPEWRGNHHRYGVMSSMTRIDGSATISVQGIGHERYEHSRTFRRITVYGKGDADVSAKAGDADIKLTPNTDAAGATRFFTALLPAPANKASITISGHMDVYGIMLDGKTGVSIDNVPMRGAAGTHFTNIDAETIEPFFRHENVGLIILQYGGNAAPGFTNAAGIEIYKQRIKSQIALFRKMAPKAKILFIGPADMATRIGGRMQTYPLLSTLCKALREAANEEGAAFWDMYSAMGGEGTIVKWADQMHPPLAGKDYVHFTQLGADKMSDYLFETLQMYYRFYRFRTGKDHVQLPDSLQHKLDSIHEVQSERLKP